MTPTSSTPTVQSTFDAAYWASQPPAVAALENIVDAQERLSAAMALAISGYVIDVPIMAWGWDPYNVMSLRLSYGLPWVPSALLPAIGAPNGYAAPGVSPLPGQTPFPTTEPVDWILTSINPANYTPYPPAPAAPAQPTSSAPNFGPAPGPNEILTPFGWMKIGG